MCSTGPDDSIATIPTKPSSGQVPRASSFGDAEADEHGHGRDPDVPRVFLGRGGEPVADRGEPVAAEPRVLARDHPTREVDHGLIDRAQHLGGLVVERGVSGTGSAEPR